MRIQKLVVMGVLTISIAILGAAPAGATIGYVNICTSLKTAFCASLGTSARGLSVDNSSTSSAGDVWFADGSESVMEFDASGNKLAEINDSNIPASADAFHETWGVAVDPADGDVYVADRGEGEGASGTLGTVTKFNSSGVFQYQLTGSATPQMAFVPSAIAVDPSTDDLYVADNRGAHIDKFTSSGTYLSQFKIHQGGEGGLYLNMVVDPSGSIYVSNLQDSDPGIGQQSEVRKYSSIGAPVDCPNGENVVYEKPENANADGPAPVAVDPSDGNIFIVEGAAAEGYFLAEYGASCAAPLADMGAGEFGNGTSGVAVNGVTHDVYATVTAGEIVTGAIFAEVVIPDVRTDATATNITRTSATVSGTINPDDTSVTRCEFEYGPTIAYGQSVPCSRSLPLTGNSPITVSANITGVSLPPSTPVHYRLRVANASAPNTGQDETFLTEPFALAAIAGVQASNVSQSSATLDGTIDPGGALVDYHFEYGTTTAYGSIAPIPDLYTPMTTSVVPVSQSVNDLQAGTTYHYRIVASSPGGTNVDGPDGTFTTLPIPAPSVGTGGANGTGVGTTTLSGVIDPHDWDTTYTFQYGTTAAYGSSWPTVPVEMGALEGAQPVSIYVQNLLPGTTYHYRLLATDGGGTAYGPDMTFTTSEYPVLIIQEPPSPTPLGSSKSKTTVKHTAKKKTTKKKSKRKKKKGKQTGGEKK